MQIVKIEWFEGLGVTQSQRQCCHLIECIRLTIQL